MSPTSSTGSCLVPWCSVVPRCALFVHFRNLGGVPNAVSLVIRQGAAAAGRRRNELDVLGQQLVTALFVAFMCSALF